MQITDTVAAKTRPGRLSGIADAGDQALSPVVGKNRRSESYNQESSGTSKINRQSGVPEGIILDVDWNRIKRFIQRFSWQAVPPESVKVIRDYWEKREAIVNNDGDRAELDYSRRQKSNGVIYGKGGGVNIEPVKPKGECSTCNSRKYVDKSNDASVSYQTPTKLNPRTAALAVGAHEREHVSNERSSADREDRKIVSQTVSIKYSICPECSIMYPSGGTTRTQSVSDNRGDESQQIEIPEQDSPMSA